MKKFLPLFLLFFATFLFSQERELPHYLTKEEKALLQWYDWTTPISFDRGIGEPPPEPVRHMAEWEELEALVVTWRQYKQILTEIIRNAKEEVKVIVIVAPSGSNSQDNAEGVLLANGVSLDNIEFVTAGSNTIWSRDYLQNTVYANDVEDRYFIDWVYNRPRPLDDILSDEIGAYLNTPVYSTTEAPTRLVNTGGNFMSDGLGTAFASKLILEENQPNNDFDAGPHDEAAIDSIFSIFMGIDRYIKFETLDFDVIHHIDMHMHLVDEETILWGQYPTGVADGPQIEANIQYLLDNHLSAFGTPYHIERIIQPPGFGGNYPNTNGDYRTYTNSVFINKTILLPFYEDQYDTIAYRIYSEHFPGYKIVGINCNAMIGALGALHCITKEVGVNDPLWIVHQRQRDISDNEQWGDYELTAHIKHRTGIESAQLYWTIDTTAAYKTLDMALVNANTNTWSASIPHQPDGTEIFYYIQGHAVSGKSQYRPLAVPTGGYYNFRVSGTPLAVDEQSPLTIEDIYPNPASAVTVIPIETSQQMEGVVEIVDVMGRLVEVLFQGQLPAGKSNVFLDARDYLAGTYFIRIKTENAVFSKKLVIQ